MADRLTDEQERQLRGLVAHAGTKDRVLWNDRDGNNIDELVLSGVTVHVEQQDDRCWWIGITRPDGTSWDGNFIADSKGRMRFAEQENDGITWDRDDEHEQEAGTDG